MVRPLPERQGAELVRFLASGFLHGLGNSLFAIHGHAQLIQGSPASAARSRGAILKATERALHGLDVMRYIAGEAIADRVQASILLARLCEYLRVPLREYGLLVRHVRGASESPVTVDGTAFCQSVAELMRHIARALPVGFEGALHIELAPDDAHAAVVRCGVHNGPSLLPFPVDLIRAIREARAVLDHHGVRAEGIADLRQLRLIVPSRDDRERAAAQLAFES